MDVRISFGTDLESVPSKVAEMLRNVDLAKPDQLISLACELIEISGDNVDMAENLLEQARVSLASLDRAISDSQSILIGYANAKARPEPADIPEPTNAD